MNTKQKILSFIETQAHMVVATCDGNTPEAAFVGFASTQELELVFGTKTNSRKYKNILSHPNVAIVFDDDKKITVQYEGIISIPSGGALETYKQIYFQKTPSSKKYENQPDQIYLKVTPTWIRYTNHGAHPYEVLEITF